MKETLGGEDYSPSNEKLSRDSIAGVVGLSGAGSAVVGENSAPSHATTARSSANDGSARDTIVST